MNDFETVSSGDIIFPFGTVSGSDIMIVTDSSALQSLMMQDMETAVSMEVQEELYQEVQDIKSTVTLIFYFLVIIWLIDKLKNIGRRFFIHE